MLFIVEELMIVDSKSNVTKDWHKNYWNKNKQCTHNMYIIQLSEQIIKLDCLSKAKN